MSGARSVVRSLKLSEVVAAFGEGRATTDQVARAYYEDRDVRKVVVGVCAQLNLSDAVDDTYQEVGVRLSSTLLARIRDADAVYGVIKATARNICKDLIRQRVTRCESSLDELIDNASDSGDSSHLRELEDHTAHHEVSNRKMDTEKACAQFNSKLANYYNSDRSIAFPKSWLDLDGSASKGVVVKKEPTKARVAEQRFSDGTLFLQRLRNVLGVSNAELGQLLAQSESVISYYLYTPRITVPEALMREARGLWESLPKTDIDNTQSLASTPVPDVVAGWMTLLGMDPQSKSANEKFAEKIGVARSTVWRWRSNKLKPKLTVLSATNKLVLALQAQKKSSSATAII